MIYVIAIVAVFAIIVFACYSELHYSITATQQQIQCLSGDYDALIECLSKEVENLEHEVETLKKQLNK